MRSFFNFFLISQLTSIFAQSIDPQHVDLIIHDIQKSAFKDINAECTVLSIGTAFDFIPADIVHQNYVEELFYPCTILQHLTRK